jgi:hypothetical protein
MEETALPDVMVVSTTFDLVMTANQGSVCVVAGRGPVFLGVWRFAG